MSSEWDKLWEGTGWGRKWFDIPLSELKEIKAKGDALQENVQFLQKSVEMLGAVRGDWLNKYNEMTVSFGQLQKANRDLAQIIFDRTEKLEVIRGIVERRNEATIWDYQKTLDAVRKEVLNNE